MDTFVKVFGAVMFMIFGAALCALGYYVQKQKGGGDYGFHEGVITVVDPEKRTFDVKYTVSGQTYDASFNAEAFFIADEVPDMGLQVQIVTKNGDESQPVNILLTRQMGRGYGSKRKYIDHDRNKAGLPFYLVGTAFVIYGLCSLII